MAETKADMPPLLMDLLLAGVDGSVELVPSQGPSKPGQLPLNTIPVGVPPVLPDTRETLEQFLHHPEKLPIHDCDRAQRSWKRTPDYKSLYTIETSPIPSTISVNRDPKTGKLIGYREEFVEGSGTTANKSMSLKRLPGPPDQSIRGSSTNLPFWPGGLEETNIDALKTTSAELTDLDFDTDLETIAPGFTKGGGFAPKKLGSLFKLQNSAPVTKLNIADVISAADDIDLGDDDEPTTGKVEDSEKEEEEDQGEKPGAKENINGLTELSQKSQVIKLTTEKVEKTDYEFAVHVDIRSPVADFHKRIPDMAYTWPFELDTFQKQAILHLENHDNVFVAAHTSAGKTVVAEYAIALSMRHMTRTIYTSPIKALSNQKFRDFKTTFEDVGLITGDVQLRPEAACLIMTTEILRSMLYNGSDVIRDLEWVIFDEVHYINDADRGVVWEEVLIMLPQHVNIILLSATVPNTMEFADWIGRTKQRKVYVVSTQKRPVPLEHFLYTGNSSKTSKELFKIVDSSKQFLTAGYSKALEAKRERASKSSQNFGAKGTRGGHPNQDKNVWLSVIEMLRKQDKLPIVAFTFSKKKINENANALHSLDLTTSTEKSEVHVFFQKCVSRLKAPDRQLPQVKELSDHLKRGVGIHHSGILPILKEVVEMLFQRGLVKILFATETFAMGVNMPARTVVFDSTRKHDGMQFRDLLPGEYIQMAGRAGRRGLDTTGTVIILVKGDVPESSDLNRMMLGKPTLLQSQFRLTYSMILNLLRVEQLRVEDMMRRSFSEFHNQKDTAKREVALKMLETKIAELPEVVDYTGDLEQYYLACKEYHELRLYLQKVVLSHPVAIKSLSPGRVVVIDTNQHRNTLGVVLAQGNTTSSAGKERTFTVLVIAEQEDPMQPPPKMELSNNEWSMPQPVLEQELYHPDGPCGQKMVTVGSEAISAITTKTLKVNGDRIIDDVNKRKIPRFRKDPPSQSTSMATQELLRLTEDSPKGLPSIDAVKDLHLRDMHLVEQFQTLDKLRQSFADFKCIQDPGFEDNYQQLATVMKMREEHTYLKFLLSEESLQLLPEYQQRVQVLKELQYIDKTGTVQLKGRLACEISNHELLITELILENALTEMPPEQIAAILSCTVFEQRNCSEPNLIPPLVKAKETFIDVARKIGLLQKECGLKMPVEDFVEQYHFGLVEVVFEWAKGLPFAEITELTDVQEGIIVRSIQRLDEVLKDVRNAARIIGDPMLYQKMEKASMLIKRDIVFAASLYTQ